jgi:hypothetical protein
MRSIVEIEKVLAQAGEKFLDRMEKQYSLRSNTKKYLKTTPKKSPRIKIYKSSPKLELQYKLYTPTGVKNNPNYYQNYLKFLRGYISMGVRF